MTERGATDGAPGGGAANEAVPVARSRRTVRVVNPRGLHPRIIDLFTKTAKTFDCAVTLWKGDQQADGKSVWDLILLVVLPDTDVILEVAGPDAAAAVEALAEILAAPAGEDYTI